jgi:tetratricopeptide (TPR) repeat protein
VAARLAYLRDANTRARDLSSRALAGRPADVDMLALYGLTYLGEPADAAQGIAALERADQIEPDRKDVLGGLVALHARAGDREKAEAAARRAEMRGDPEPAEHAREALAMLDIDEADEALESGDLPKAIALLRAARDRTARQTLKSKIDDRILELEIASKKRR